MFFYFVFFIFMFFSFFFFFVFFCFFLGKRVKEDIISRGIYRMSFRHPLLRLAISPPRG